MTNPVFWARAAFAVLALLVGWLTLTPNPEDTQSGFALAQIIADLVFDNPALTDKVAHFLAYAALGTLAFWSQLSLFGRGWAAPLALAAYGALLEGAQGLGGVRAMDPADAAANGLGALAGYAGAYLLARLYALRAP